MAGKIKRLGRIWGKDLGVERLKVESMTRNKIKHAPKLNTGWVSGENKVLSNSWEGNVYLCFGFSFVERRVIHGIAGESIRFY